VFERDDFEDLDIDGRMAIKWFYKKWGGGVGWIDLA
jgi:hypothetical protein